MERYMGESTEYMTKELAQRAVAFDVGCESQYVQICAEIRQRRS